LRDLFSQIGQANQIFLRGIRQKGKSASRKFHFGVLFGSLIKIHLPSKPEENSKKKLTSLPPIRYGLKWLNPVQSTSCVLIGTDITRNPFLQALIRKSNPEATEIAHPFKPSQRSIYHRKKLSRDTAASAR
jgi:hypothetical protein